MSLKKSGGEYEMSVSTMEIAENILRYSGDGKIKELRACLECKSLTMFITFNKGS